MYQEAFEPDYEYNFNYKEYMNELNAAVRVLIDDRNKLYRHYMMRFPFDGKILGIPVNIDELNKDNFLKTFNDCVVQYKSNIPKNENDFEYNILTSFLTFAEGLSKSEFNSISKVFLNQNFIQTTKPKYTRIGYHINVYIQYKMFDKEFEINFRDYPKSEDQRSAFNIALKSCLKRIAINFFDTIESSMSKKELY